MMPSGSTFSEYIDDQTSLAAPRKEGVPPPLPYISSSDLLFGNKLGDGVYECRWNSRSLTVAVKRLKGELEEGEVGSLCGVYVILTYQSTFKLCRLLS